MAHEVETMAWAGETPWHGLGTEIQADAPLDDWIQAAGFNWELEVTPLYTAERNMETLYPLVDRVALRRSDTKETLHIASRRYQVVQPSEIAEFFREFTELAGYKMETMGVLRGGRVYWGLARVGAGFNLGSKAASDEVNPFVLLASSADGSMATVAHLTSVRVVCQNTLRLSVGSRGADAAVRIPHVREFDPDEVKDQLGLVPNWWDEYQNTAKQLTKVEVSREQAIASLLTLYVPNVGHLADDSGFLQELVTPDWRPTENDLGIPGVRQAYRSRNVLIPTLEAFTDAPGNELKHAAGTAWGLLNGVTRFWDHERKQRVPGSRLDKAFFGRGATAKTGAYNMLRKQLSA